MQQSILQVVEFINTWLVGTSCGILLVCLVMYRNASTWGTKKILTIAFYIGLGAACTLAASYLLHYAP